MRRLALPALCLTLVACATSSTGQRGDPRGLKGHPLGACLPGSEDDPTALSFECDGYIFTILHLPETGLAERDEMYAQVLDEIVARQVRGGDHVVAPTPALSVPGAMVRHLQPASEPSEGPGMLVVAGPSPAGDLLLICGFPAETDPLICEDAAQQTLAQGHPLPRARVGEAQAATGSNDLDRGDWAFPASCETDPATPGFALCDDGGVVTKFKGADELGVLKGDTEGMFRMASKGFFGGMRSQLGAKAEISTTEPLPCQLRGQRGLCQRYSVRSVENDLDGAVGVAPTRSGGSVFVACFWPPGPAQLPASCASFLQLPDESEL